MTFKDYQPSTTMFSLQPPQNSIPPPPPPPRLKSLIKLEHLTRPSPSFRFSQTQKLFITQTNPTSTPTTPPTTPPSPKPSLPKHRPFLTIDGLKTRYSVQLSDSTQSDYNSINSSESQNFKTPSTQQQQPFKLSTDSHPHRLLPQSTPKLNYYLNRSSSSSTKPFKFQQEQQPSSPSNPSLSSSPSSSTDQKPINQNYPKTNYHHQLSPQDFRSYASYPEERPVRQSLKDKYSLEEPRDTYNLEQRILRSNNNFKPRSIKSNNNNNTQALKPHLDHLSLEPINTRGLSAFIRPIKYGILQLTSASNSIINPTSINQIAPLHLRLWIKDSDLLDPIPANLIVISPDGHQIELLKTDFQVNQSKAQEQDLRRSYEAADRRVSFYSLQALPIELRTIYNYLQKYLMIIFSGIPRAVFQLHTPHVHQPVRCAIMMNLPLPDLHLEWLLLSDHHHPAPSHPTPPIKFKLKLSRSRKRFKVWTNGSLLLDHPIQLPPTLNLDQPLSDQWADLLRNSFLSSQYYHQDNQSIDRLENFLSFFHSCLSISIQIEHSLLTYPS